MKDIYLRGDTVAVLAEDLDLPATEEPFTVVEATADQIETGVLLTSIDDKFTVVIAFYIVMGLVILCKYTFRLLNIFF